MICLTLTEHFLVAGDRVMVYRDQIYWTTQLYGWVLAVTGVDAKLLNMRFTTGVNEARPINHGRPTFSPTEYPSQRNTKWVANKQTVSYRIDNPAIALVHALSAAQYVGQGQAFGRPRRLPGGIGVPSRAMIDPKKMRLDRSKT